MSKIDHLGKVCRLNTNTCLNEHRTANIVLNKRAQLWLSAFYAIQSTRP